MTIAQVSLRDGMMKLPGEAGEKGTLLGSRCGNCGERFFVIREICESCQSTSLEDIQLSATGSLYAFSVMYYPPPPPYRGPDPFVPFGIGWVELPEGLLVYLPLTESNPRKLQVGMKMDLTFGVFTEDEQGNDIIVPLFAPRQEE
ncbi:MAG: DNA-binding protein [Halieaceae bacterium]|jgi:uncharacterized protein|nr:DNA-binding protein [Halieaceae bacterium]